MLIDSSTKIILRLKAQEKPACSSAKLILNTFSGAGIINVLVLCDLQNRSSTGMYHNPYQRNPSEPFTMCPVKKNWIVNCFPRKIRQQSGYQYELVGYQNPPFFFVVNNTYYGLSLYMLDLVLTHWNATYTINMKSISESM